MDRSSWCPPNECGRAVRGDILRVRRARFIMENAANALGGGSSPRRGEEGAARTGGLRGGGVHLRTDTTRLPSAAPLAGAGRGAGGPADRLEAGFGRRGDPQRPLLSL